MYKEDDEKDVPSATNLSTWNNEDYYYDLDPEIVSKSRFKSRN